MGAEKIMIIFYIFIFIFCSLYLVLFSIVLYRTIVTVYADNIFLYNYLRQMHQILHLSPVGCFTPARSKIVQINREVSGVNTIMHIFQFFSFSHIFCVFHTVVVITIIIIDRPVTINTVCSVTINTIIHFIETRLQNIQLAQ